MSFETVSEESRPFRPVVSSPISPVGSKSPQCRCRVSDSGESALPESRHHQINTYLKKLQGLGFFGRAQVKDYLSDQQRRNCRPNTLKSSFGTLALFFSYLKERGHAGIETITREDLSSYIEHEQDRGMKPRTVSTRLRHLYAFLRFLEDREVVHPDLLKKKAARSCSGGLAPGHGPGGRPVAAERHRQAARPGHGFGIAADRDAHRGIVGYPGE
jgi:hypothetical protein